MEQLASMVLNGDGQYLIGAKSNQMEIQAFLDNVPAYMVFHITQILLKCFLCRTVSQQLTFHLSQFK